MGTDAHLVDVTTSRIAFIKTTTAISALSTYEVRLDGEPIGSVSRVRHAYLRRLGGHRGNNVHAARTDWILSTGRVHFDTRAEAAIALIADATGMSYGAALDIVRARK